MPNLNQAESSTAPKYLNELVEVVFTDEEVRMLVYAYNRKADGPYISHGHQQVGYIGIPFAIECLTAIVKSDDHYDDAEELALSCLDAIKRAYAQRRETSDVQG